MGKKRRESQESVCSVKVTAGANKGLRLGGRRTDLRAGVFLEPIPPHWLSAALEPLHVQCSQATSHAEQVLAAQEKGS